MAHYKAGKDYVKSVDALTGILKDGDMLELLMIRNMFRETNILTNSWKARYKELREILKTRHGMDDACMNHVLAYA